MELEDKAKEIASVAINRMIEEDNYDAVHELAARVARAESSERLLDISGLDFDNQTALRQFYIEIVGGIPHGNTLDLSALSAPVRDAFETVTVGLLAWQESVKERNKDYSDCFEQLGVKSLAELVDKLNAAEELTECPHCVSFTERIKRTIGSW